MSYARFSSDNWRSDVYVYESESGYMVHVARSRLLWPPVPSFMWTHLAGRVFLRLEKYQASYAQRCALWLFYRVVAASHWLHHFTLRIIPRAKIGLPYDGDTITCDDAAACLFMLRKLRLAGYWVPTGAIAALEEECAESEAGR